MSIALKKVLSYFIDIPIEQRESIFSGTVEVSLSQGQYKLSTKNVIYSYGKKYTSFGTAFKVLDIKTHSINNVLVLGLGLGSVIDLLEHHPAIQQVIAVDLDKVIIELAQKYLQTSLKNKTIYSCDDAGSFIKNNQEKFDLVLFDVFIEEFTPVQFMQPEFLKMLKQSVNKNGMLLFSKIDDSVRSKIENTQFSQNFSTVFHGAFSIDANGNKIFVWMNK